MTPHEKAVNALNRRLERLQVNLREAELESARRFLFQSLVVSIGVGEALNDYIKMVGQYAQRRHGELKQTNDALGARHAELLQSGKELLEQLKANPTDRGIRKQIEVAQQDMAAIQKTLRRGANALQRDVAPGIAMIDPLAEILRRLSEAEEVDALKRLLKMAVGQVRELYGSQPSLPNRHVVDAEAWEKSVVNEIDEATGFYDAYARAGYQTMLALELMTIAVSPNPAQTSEEASHRAAEAIAARLKDITARLMAP